MTITTEIGYGKWNDRKSLDYIPCNSPLDGKFYGPYGDIDPFERRPYKIEEDGGVSYVMYDEDSNGAVIYRITEE